MCRSVCQPCDGLARCRPLHAPKCSGPQPDVRNPQQHDRSCNRPQQLVEPRTGVATTDRNGAVLLCGHIAAECRRGSRAEVHHAFRGGWRLLQCAILLQPGARLHWQRDQGCAVQRVCPQPGIYLAQQRNYHSGQLCVALPNGLAAGLD